MTAKTPHRLPVPAGLSVTRHDASRTWFVRHVDSGLPLHKGGFRIKADALDAVAALTMLVGTTFRWDRPADQVLAELADSGRRAQVQRVMHPGIRQR